jgi:hypothetical protein
MIARGASMVSSGTEEESGASFCREYLSIMSSLTDFEKQEEWRPHLVRFEAFAGVDATSARDTETDETRNSLRWDASDLVMDVMDSRHLASVAYLDRMKPVDSAEDIIFEQCK